MTNFNMQERHHAPPRPGKRRNIGLTRWRECFDDGRIFNISHITGSNMRPGGMPAAHRHDFAEVFWVNHGRCEHAINGEQRMVRSGQLCFIRPRRDAHALRIPPGATDFYNVAFPAPVLRDLCGRYPDLKKFWTPKTTAPTVIQLTELELQWLTGAADTLMHVRQDRMLLDRFLLSLICSIRQGQNDPWRACPAWLREAERGMRQPENFTSGIPAFAKLCRRSPAHVARVLKKHTGMTPLEVVNQARMRHAVTQLTSTTDDILTIALDCGFDSLSYFYRLFRRRFGTTPRRYRHDHFAIPARIGLT